MPEEKYVPVTAFIATTKMLMSVIHDLTVAMQVQRVALLRIKATDLPVQPEYLKNLERNIRQAQEFRNAREGILSMSTPEEIDEALRKLEGL